MCVRCSVLGRPERFQRTHSATEYDESYTERHTIHTYIEYNLDVCVCVLVVKQAHVLDYRPVVCFHSTA